VALRTDQDGATYEVRLDFFEGPLDLLLFLIRKKKINIHDIPIAIITREYLEYLEKKQHINLEREAEFLLMAAILIYIKSQMLLPREKNHELEEDPRQPLVHQLLDYERIKKISQLLRAREERQIKLWSRRTYPISLSPTPEDEMDLEEISIFDLAEKFFSLLKMKEESAASFPEGKKHSLEEKIQEILLTLKKHGFLDFHDYFYRQRSLEEALVSFFALLELIKRKVVMAIQDNLFQPIKVWILQGRNDEYPA
jgi:segregation and condensation protein A